MLFVLGTAGWLGMMSILDIRYRRVPVWLLGIGGALGAIYAALQWTETARTVTGMLWDLLPGILFLILSFVTGNVGYGDGIVLLILGGIGEEGKGLLAFRLSLFFSAFGSVILLAAGKAGRRTRIPYLPFLTAAWLIAGFI